MSRRTHGRRRQAAALVAAVLVAAVATAATASAQTDSGSGDSTTTTTAETTTTTTAQPTTTVTDPSSTTTTVVVPPPDDPGAVEDLPAEPVPVVPDTVPPRPEGAGPYSAQAGRIIRRQLEVAQVEAIELESAYAQAKQRVIDLDAELDRLEMAVTSLAVEDQAAVRRVEIARRRFEARAASAVIRGGTTDFMKSVVVDDPNELAVAETLLGSVMQADHDAVREYLEAKAAVDADLVRTAERLVEARLELDVARAALVDARRASVAAQFNLAVFAAGSEIAIHGFVFPVGDPHSFIDSFGFPRMMGTEYEHAHQGTDIMAPMGTPLLACERGIVTRIGTDVLGGLKIWLKGESGTYYYYAHLSEVAPEMHEGLLVEAGTVIGFVGDSGNAKGGAPHLHFEIHPDGGPAVNPYPLLKVVDDLTKRAKSATS